MWRIEIQTWFSFSNFLVDNDPWQSCAIFWIISYFTQRRLHDHHPSSSLCALCPRNRGRTHQTLHDFPRNIGFLCVWLVLLCIPPANAFSLIRYELEKLYGKRVCIKVKCVATHCRVDYCKCICMLNPWPCKIQHDCQTTGEQLFVVEKRVQTLHCPFILDALRLARSFVKCFVRQPIVHAKTHAHVFNTHTLPSWRMDKNQHWIVFNRTRANSLSRKSATKKRNASDTHQRWTISVDNVPFFGVSILGNTLQRCNFSSTRYSMPELLFYFLSINSIDLTDQHHRLSGTKIASL